MKTLLAIDGSIFGGAALSRACEIIGAQLSPEVRVLTAYEVLAPVMSEPFVPMPVYSQEIVDELRQKAEEIAAGAVEKLTEKLPEAAISSCVKMDEPGAAIVSEAKAWNADLIIVGSHGHGIFGRVLLGSVSDYVIHHAPCSVMVVRSSNALNRNGNN
ncbi:MAG: universal stress protein [Pyrinomonadaceae bacterium]